MTSDRPPSEIAKLEERLRSRFEAGLIVDVAPPDFKLRCAITQIKAKDRHLDLTMEQIQMIAANLDATRKIEGALIKIMTQMMGRRVEITDDMVQGIIGKGVETNGKQIKKDPVEIIDAICRYYRIGKRSLLGESRVRPLARPRQILMYILRTDLQISLEEVGRLVGGRDHTSLCTLWKKLAN